MHAAKLQKYGLGALAAALATLLVIGGLSYRDWVRYERDFEQANEARRILSLNESLIARMLEAETGQRGFILTNKQEYLSPYNTALEKIPSDLRELAVIVAEGPSQSDRYAQLQSAIADKLAELRKTIELRRSEGLDAALAVVQSDQGKRTMDRIRALSQELEVAEDARRMATRNDLLADTNRTRIATLIGAILLVALVGGATIALKSAAGQMERLNLLLSDAKRSAEGTSDLLQATLYSISDGVITTNRDGAVGMMNSVAERLTGYPESEARGRLSKVSSKS